MPRKVLSQEAVVVMLTLKEKGMSNKAIANLLGVTEGAVELLSRVVAWAEGIRRPPA